MDQTSICSARASRNFTAAPRLPTSRSYAARRRSGSGSLWSSGNPITRARSSTGSSKRAPRTPPDLILNPAGYTTTSIAILDALHTIEAPVIEVHITNIHARESFRQHSYVSLAARAVVCGFGIEGYALAIAGSPP